jgi:hypothetical protein
LTLGGRQRKTCAYLGELAADCPEFLLKLSIGVMYFGVAGIDGFFFGKAKLRN